jgi:spore coat protein JB
MEANMSHVHHDCDYKDGTLMPCAPLAIPYVPFQQEGSPKYKSEDALARGTLFPGLDLPWKNVVNETAGHGVDTPMGELMTLHFVVYELGLYLDTHPEDKEALDMYVRYANLYKAGSEEFAKRYGPITQDQVTTSGFTWIDDPWPWEYMGHDMQPKTEMDKHGDMHMHMDNGMHGDRDMNMGMDMSIGMGMELNKRMDMSMNKNMSMLGDMEGMAD